MKSKKYFHAVVVLKTFPFMYYLLLYDWHDFFWNHEARVISFSGYKQKYKNVESSYGNMSAHKFFLAQIRS